MNCREARSLLDQGLTPGPYAPDRATLGFHLAGCAECREYRAALQERLLAELLTQQSQPALPTAILPAPAPQATTLAAQPVRLRDQLVTLFWYGGLGMLGILAVVTIVTVSSLFLSIFHIHQNVQAMIVPTAPGMTDEPQATATRLPTAEPAVGLPSATPRPSATPLPSPTPRPTATPTPAAPPAGDAITILMLGSDRRPDESEPSRTDAIIVARIDPQIGRVALLSLPRDLWVEVPGYGQTRINAASMWGHMYGEPGGGLALAKKTVSHLLGVPIDYAVYIDFEGFIGAVDALGGVMVDVERELYDPQFPTMDYGYTVAHFLPGPQLMDGATALMYSRIRHPDSDFARMRRQQAVIGGALARLREQNLLDSVQSIEDITAALRDYVQTDMPMDRMIGLAWALRGVAPEQIERYALDASMVSFGVGNDRYAEIALPGAIEGLVQQLLGQ